MPKPSSPTTATRCAEQATVVGPACAQLIEQLLADRIVERLRAAQGVLRLADRYGNTRLEAASVRALAHDSPFYRTVKTILAGASINNRCCRSPHRRTPTAVTRALSATPRVLSASFPRCTEPHHGGMTHEPHSGTRSPI